MNLLDLLDYTLPTIGAKYWAKPLLLCLWLLKWKGGYYSTLRVKKVSGYPKRSGEGLLTLRPGRPCSPVYSVSSLLLLPPVDT